MKICDISGAQIEACVKIQHRGCEISLSTVFNQPSLCVFTGAQNITDDIFFGQREVYPSAENIAKAIAFINATFA